MNSKLLYAATLAISLVSTLAMADEAPVTRAQVQADVLAASVNGTLQRGGQGAYQQPVAGTSTVTRAAVTSDLAQAQASGVLIGMNGNREAGFATPTGPASTLTRAEVRNDVLQAVANGTLERTYANYGDNATEARSAKQHVDSVKLAQRLKAKFAKTQG